MTTQEITKAQNETHTFFTLRHLSLFLVLIGIIVSGYLSYTKFTEGVVVCIEGEAFDCSVVENSIYSEFLGIPVAYLGLATYLLLGALLLFENHAAILEENGRLIVFGISLFAFVFSMWLVYVQVVLLEALCVWCLTHEINITILFAVSSIRLWRDLNT